MSLLIGLGDSSWQRASPQFPARLSAWSLGLVQHPCQELLDGGLLSLYLVPTAPAAWHEVSLNCSGSNRKPFLLSALFCFFFLSGEQVGYSSQGRSCWTTHQPSIRRHDRVSPACFSWWRGHCDATLGILSSDCQLQPWETSGFSGALHRASVLLLQ